MTELYNGPWNPASGDLPRVKQPKADPYHPRYPEIKVAGQEVTVQVAQNAVPAK